MTTIAYKDGWLVSDSRETSKDRIDTDRCKKIYRLPDGALYGGAGDSCSIQALHHHLVKASRSKPKKLPNICIKGVHALLIHDKTFYYERGSWQPINYPFAIGSGSHYAIAAMDAGCTAEEAVRIAIKRDVYSGGRIQKYRIQ